MTGIRPDIKPRNKYEDALDGMNKYERALRDFGDVQSGSSTTGLPPAEPGDDVETIQPYDQQRGPIQANWTQLEDAMKDQAMGMVTAGPPGMQAMGSALGAVGKGAKAVLTGIKANSSLPAAAAIAGASAVVPGKLGGNFLRYHAGRMLLGRLLGSAAPAAEEAAAVPTDYNALMSKAFKIAGAEGRAGTQGSIAMERGLANAASPEFAPPPVPEPDLGAMFKMAGNAGREASVGNAKMAQGIANIPESMARIAPDVPQPLTLEEMLSSAGEAGRRATEGRAAMEAGLRGAAQQAATPSPADRLGKAMNILSKGMPGAGKPGMGNGLDFGAVGAAGVGAGAASLQPPALPQLSTNAAQARQIAMQSSQAGQSQQQIQQQLAAQFDPATVKFVLASLPNRLPM